MLGDNLMHIYGPERLVGGIRQLDQEHNFEFEVFAERSGVAADHNGNLP